MKDFFELRESLQQSKINQLTRVGWMDGDVLTVEDDDISTLQRDLKGKGYTKSSSVKKGLETHMVYTSKGKPDIFLSYDGQNDAAYVSYNKRSVFESVELGEARKDAAKDTYFSTYSAAVQYAKAQAEKQGYEVEEDDWFDQVTTGKGKPGRGKTTRHTLKLMKGGKPTRKGLAIQVYNRDTDKNPYELNYYVS